MNKIAKCYGLYEEDKIIGFLAVLHQPHSKVKNIKRVTRLVILPDYQGIGLGKKFLNEIAKIYTKQGYIFHITTSARNMIKGLQRDKNWQLRSWGFHKGEKSRDYNNINKYLRSKCKTATFRYKPS